MQYLKNEMVLLQSLKFKREDIKEALNNILDGYNKLFNMAVHQQQYIKEKRPEFAREMEENFKLVERNKYLENENREYKNLYMDQLSRIKTLEKTVRYYSRILDRLQTKEEETWKD